jgi:mono/diheme cytochrome c family protein
MPSSLLTRAEAVSLAAALFASRAPAFEAAPEVRAPAGDPRRGRELVQRRGCLGCHALADPTPLPNLAGAPPWEGLRPGQGCLAPLPPAKPGVPRFRLGAEQRADAAAFLESQRERPDRSVAPVHAFLRRVEQLRCHACHAIEHLAPPVAPPEAVPQLTGAGSKLRPEWISAVLGQKQRVRDYLQLRMPHYDPTVSAPLALLFAKAAGAPARVAAPTGSATAATLRRRGHGLLGTRPERGGLGCIGCHGWGKHKALGEAGPDLDTVAARLRPEFFRRWMRDPTRVVSGTSMPSYFASATVAEADATIDALWAALSLGARGPVPEGYQVETGAAADEDRPEPTDTPIVVRAELPGATPAGIAVGFPGGRSFCFDAGESRLRFVWRGGFVDLTPTLLKKTDGNKSTPTAAIVGERVYASEAFPIRIGARDRLPAVRFRGYQLVSGVPRFHYEVDGVSVHETIVAVPAGLRRTLELDEVTQPAWLLDARGPGDVVEIPRGKPARIEVVIPVEGSAPSAAPGEKGRGVPRTAGGKS